MPPYSNKLSDYIATPGKINVVVIAPYAWDGIDLPFYLHGTIMKTDESVIIRTKGNYKSAQPMIIKPVSLPNGTYVTPPFTVPFSEILQVFSEQNLEYIGITKKEVMQKGLPEGTYTICFDMFFYPDNRNIANSCSAPFYVSSVEPPMVINPLNNTSLNETTAKNLVFNWTRPVNSPITTQYKLKVIELNDLNDNYQDKIRSDAYPTFFTTTVPANAYLYSVANPLFTKGKSYAFVVQAIDPAGGTAFKNNGYSEVNVFTYPQEEQITQTENIESNFEFFNPRKFNSNKPDTLKVNNQNNMLINWGWIQNFKKDSSKLVDIEQIKALNLQKYKLTLTRNADKKIIVDKVFEKNAENSIKNFLQLNKDETVSAGLKDGEKYFATIEAIDNKEKIYNTFKSNDFVFRLTKDEAEQIKLKFTGTLRYEYQKSPETYPVMHTDVIVNAYMKANSFNLPNNKMIKQSTPIEKIRGVDYQKIASQATTTDEKGMILDSLMIAQNLLGNDTLFFSVKIGNRYYVDKELPMAKMPSIITDYIKDSVGNIIATNYRKDNNVSFGNLTAKTYAYKLKLNVNKKFTEYSIVNTGTGTINVSLVKDPNKSKNQDAMKSDLQKSVAGLPVVLYREYKQDYIPPYEGDIKPEYKEPVSGTNLKLGTAPGSSAAKKYATQVQADAQEQVNQAKDEVLKRITVVAVGVTKIEDGKSMVEFDRLLSTNFKSEEYKILAITNLEEWLKSEQKNNQKSNQKSNLSKTATSKSSVPSNLSLNTKNALALEKAIADLNTNTGNYNTNFVDSNKFVAEVMPFKLALPPDNAGADAYYRTVEADYDIISCKPPTSIIKGRLFYEWPSSKKVKRPLSNAHFRVIVNYVDAKTKQPLGDLSTLEVPFIPKEDRHRAIAEYSGGYAFSVADQFATMGTGTTDSDGNFEIEVVNMNKKGSLGPVDITYYSNHKKLETSDAKEIQTPYLQEINVANFMQSVVNPNPTETNYVGNVSQNTQNAQGAINSGMNVQFDSGLGSYELNNPTGKTAKGGAGTQKMVHQQVEDYVHGPNPTDEIAPPPLSYTQGTNSPFQQETYEKVNTEHFDDLLRVYRIVITGENGSCYYPSAGTITIQPFEANATPYEINHFVKEMKIIAFTTKKNPNNNNIEPLTQMQVTVFRDVDTKIKNLPLGEGDGKYDFKPLINPEYTTKTGAQVQSNDINSADVFTKKFEHLWSGVQVSDLAGKAEANASKGYRYGVELNKLIYTQMPYYFVESSSALNIGSTLSYGALIYGFGKGHPDVFDPDYINPTIPEFVLNFELKPLLSRAQMKVRDAETNKLLTSDYAARVYINDVKNTTTVDKYGYAEFVADKPPLSNFLQPKNDNEVKLQFYAAANGYKSSEAFEARLHYNGENAEKDFGLTSGGTLRGNFWTKDQPKDMKSVTGNLPVPCYIQVDSGKIFETDNSGVLKEVRVAYTEKSRIKIIPKDVAYFDSIYTISAEDFALSHVFLPDFQIYRRRHRITIKLKEENNNQGIFQATVKLGDMIEKTYNGSTARFVFENVSVNNYSVIVKGPEESGYIPKVVNIKNQETKDYVTYEIPMEKGSEVSGTVKLDGVPVKNARVYLDVSNTSSKLSSNIPGLSSNTGAYSTSKAGTSLPGKASNTSFPEKETLTDNSANLVVAYSDSNGKFTLRGIPADNAGIEVHATLDTTFTVSGAENIALIKNKVGSVNLEMTSFKKARINNIYAFPLTIEKIDPINDKQVKVTGLVHWTKGISKFELNDELIPLRVEDVVFDLVNKGGVTVGEAKPDEVQLNGISSLKLSLLNKYNVQLLSTDGNSMFNTSPLRLVRQDNRGKISGKMKIVDNSFNYPSTYLNFDKSEFYLATLSGGNSVNNTLDLVSSAMSIGDAFKPEYSSVKLFTDAVDNIIKTAKQNAAADKKSNITATVGTNKNASGTLGYFNLCDKDAQPIAFKLIRFDAKANPLKSYMDDQGKIHLNTDLTCTIPNAQPENFKVNIPEIILDENKINPTSSNTPIQVMLEDWVLEAKNWSFSVEEGGILSKNAVIRTKLLDIPLKKFVLRSDMFLMKDFELHNLSLGGGKFKLIIDTLISKPQLNYEYRAGSDMQPHWNFSMLSNGKDKVASLEPLNGLKIANNKDYIIDFDYLQILSNNEMVAQMKQKEDAAHLMGNPLASFKPLSLYNGPNYIELKGALNIGAPRIPDFVLTLNYPSTKAEPTYENVSLDFETKGFVHFTIKDKKLFITKDLISIENGIISEPKANTFNPIPGSFYAHANSSPTYEVKMKKGWVTQLTSSENQDFSNMQQKTSSTGYSLKIDEGGMTAEKGGDWDICTFRGLMHDNTDSKDNIKDSSMEFKVLGDIAANSDEVKVSGVDTPFGSMTQTFDFKTKTLIGTVKIKDELTVGSFIIHKGTIETLFSPSGFYVTGGCYAYVPAGLVAGDYNLGFMMGAYPLTDHLWNVTNSYIDPSVVNQCYRNKTTKLSGIYAAFNREFINKNVTFDFILVSGYIKALGLLGGDMYFNVADGWKLGFDAYAHVDVRAGISAITGTSLKNGVLIGDARLMFQIGNPSYFQADLMLNFNATISQSLLVTTITKDISIGCKATGGTNGFDFSLGDGNQKLGCP